MRLLFYIGFHRDEATYREALTYFTDWKTTPPTRYDYRCNAFAYVVANTLPPKVREAKPYILPLFCEVVGYEVQ